MPVVKFRRPPVGRLPCGNQPAYLNLTSTSDPSDTSTRLIAPSSPETKLAARHPPHGQLVTAESETRQRELTGPSISRNPDDREPVRHVVPERIAEARRDVAVPALVVLRLRR